MLLDKKILIFGGSGSLGNELISRYIKNNKIYNFSRDECKHWKMEQLFKSENLTNIIGDIRDRLILKQTLLRVKPNIIIIAAAMKHIDRCEINTSECVKTNIIGIQNILHVIEFNFDKLSDLTNVVFISTDKATSPVNIYGGCKFISEMMMQSKANHYQKENIKFNIVRYGNVLNSRGSILKILHHIGKSDDCKYFKLTDKRMTRFIMTLSESVNLIEYAILKGKSGQIIIPRLKSMKIFDLIQIFSKLYNKHIKVIGIRPGEKLHEELINETQSLRTHTNTEYYHIEPNFLKMNIENKQIFNYNSSQGPVSQKYLNKYLSEIKML